MIPIKLTIQGLYSYQDKQTIDFTKLTAANLFGIFGQVGSGKSSILEAITFAVYGKTDRLNLSGDNRNYNMMNLKSDELLIDFIFETGKQQTEYRATVHGKRNSKKFEEVRKLDRKVYRKKDKQWIPVEVSEMENAIGLSYDNFKRTIIIPQGQFQEFLQLGNKDRTQMMKELFNLQKFELYGRVATIESKNNAQIQNREGKLQQLGDIDQDQEKKLNGEIEKLKNELTKLEKEIKELQQRNEKSRSLSELIRKIEEAGKRLIQMKRKENEFKNLEKEIEDFELCSYHFKHILESYDNSLRRIQQKEKQIKKDKNEENEEEKELIKIQDELKKIKREYDNREELKLKAEELKSIEKIGILNDNIKKNRGRQNSGQIIFQKTVNEIKLWQKERDTIAFFIKGEKDRLPDTGELTQVKSWYVKEKGLKEQLDNSKRDGSVYKNEKKDIEERFYQLLGNCLFEKMRKNGDVNEILIFLPKKKREIEKQISLLNEKAVELRLKEKLQAFADEITDGKQCPLCGSLEHPSVYNSKDTHEAQENLKRELRENEKTIQNIDEVTKKVNELYNQQQNNIKYYKKWKNRNDLLEQNINLHRSTFKWDKYGNENEVESALLLMAKINSEVKKKEEKLEKLDIKIKKRINDKEKYQKELDKIKTVLTEDNTELKTLKEQLKIVSFEEYTDKAKEDIILEQSRLNSKYNELEEVFNKLSDSLTKHSKSKNTLTGRIEGNKLELKEERENYKKIEKKIYEELSRTRFLELDEVRKILEKRIDVEIEKRRLTDYKNQFIQLSHQLDLLNSEKGDRKYNEEEHKKIINKLEETNLNYQQSNQELGKLTGALKKLRDDLKSKRSLKNELERLTLRADNIRVMKSLFKGSGFVNYISSVYLQNLCNVANERFFQLTRQKLSLEITSENNFQVRDFMNGGKVRSVKTLSGGQTFQAALSLALALADNIQKITESNQNFFFLDEGFGSLDKESLSIVFETLKTLRKENRIVGVISHVEEMQEEIDVHLRIENNEERGSIIHSSWDE